ncbi:MAG: hemolysin family protein [Candidatus Acidiferrales bacterium]
MTAIQIFGILLLIAANAFFSASEFSLVAVRLSRIRQLVQQGDPRAKVVENLLGDLGRVVSGVQVGLTIASLSLGYLGEVTLVSILQPFVNEMTPRWATIVEHGAAIVIVFGLLTILQVVFGELVPKALSLARAERVALLIARPFYWFVHTFRWAIDLLDGFSEKVVGALGILSPQSHTLIRSIEELQVMIQQVRDLGLLPASEAKFIQNAMELSQVQVRDIMVPRPDIHALPSDASIDDTMQMFATTQRSRIPVYEGTLDHVLGFVHLKDVMWALLDRSRAHDGEPAPFRLTNFLREVVIAPETKPASELLRELLARRTGLAMIVDEFGSILGLATLEDIVEQMIGEIHDEFDVVERPMMLPDGSMIFEGATNVRDLEVQYSIVVPEDAGYSTVAGFVLARLGFIPRGGESFEEGGYRFTVMEMDRKRVSRVKIKALQPPEASSRGASLSGEPSAASATAQSAAEYTKVHAAAMRERRAR